MDLAGINNYKKHVKILLHEDIMDISKYIGGYKGFDWINNYKNVKLLLHEDKTLDMKYFNR